MVGDHLGNIGYRVAVIGNAGGGKSRLCRLLSETQNLPYHAIDKIQWRPGWQLAPKDEFIAVHDEILKHEKWIIDGVGPWNEIEKRFERADTIIFVDHSLWIHYWWAAKRQFFSIFRERSDGPDGCPMLPVTFRLFRMMRSVHYELRPKVIAAIETHRQSTGIFHIRSPKDLAAFCKLHCRRPPISDMSIHETNQG